jgi:transposase
MKGFKRLQQYLDKFSTDPAHFLILSEPTGGYYGYALQMYLKQKGYALLQVENRAVKEYREDVYGSETKTDDTDARLMTRMGFLHEWVGEEFSIQPIHIASPDESVLRLMSRDLGKLTKEITRRKNQLHQLFSFTFPELKTFFRKEITGTTVCNLMKKFPTPQELKKASIAEIAEVLHKSHAYGHAKRASELLALAQTSAGVQMVSHHLWRQAWILNQIDVLEPARNDLIDQIRQLTASHPYCPIIESLPVKSPIWTATLISVIRDVNRFSNYAEFKAYMGWFPQVEQSGTSVYSTELANDGVRLGRNVFSQMVITLITPSIRTTPFRIHYQRLVDRGKRKSSAVGHVAAKLCCVLYGCLKTMTPYNEQKHRKKLGLPDESETTKEEAIEIAPESIDESEEYNDIPSSVTP